jgi:hypothetical protein
MSSIPKVAYRYSRLTFHRDSIEPLSPDDVFRIETPVGIFQMTKQQFQETFASVAQSHSYKSGGSYNYKQVPEKAKAFRISESEILLPRGRRTEYLPPFLQSVCSETVYKKWLHRKAVAHVKRDRKRWQIELSVSAYKQAIHSAVLEGGQHDAYTGDMLDWKLISKYDNDDSRLGRKEYKKSFGLLPTVDHAGDKPGDMNFRICSWRTNDAKSDLSLDEFLDLCRKVLRHQAQKQDFK